jgi:hypothetical protein
MKFLAIVGYRCKYQYKSQALELLINEYYNFLDIPGALLCRAQQIKELEDIISYFMTQSIETIRKFLYRSYRGKCVNHIEDPKTRLRHVIFISMIKYIVLDLFTNAF